MTSDANGANISSASNIIIMLLRNEMAGRDYYLLGKVLVGGPGVRDLRFLTLDVCRCIPPWI